MNSIENAFFYMDSSLFTPRLPEITNKKIEETTEKIIEKIFKRINHSLINWSYFVSSRDIYIYNTSVNHLNTTTKEIFQNITKNVIEKIKPHAFIREKIIKIIAFPFVLDLEKELGSINRFVNNNIIYPN